MTSKTEFEVWKIVNECAAFMQEGMFQHAQSSQRPPANAHPVGSFKGPRTLTLSRDNDGFGFTLRYFIVYPPSGQHDSKKEEGFQRNSYWSNLGLGDEGSSGRSSPLPLDTFFVRHVVAGGSADRAGLNNGDRIVSINGQLIGGQTHKDVVELIQRCNGDLKLGVVPRGEDILQLVYQEYVRNSANLGQPEDCDQTTRELDSSNMQLRPSVNKWNTPISARQISSPAESNIAEEKKFEPCVCFVSGTPVVNKSLSSSISSSGANTPAFAASGTSSPPRSRNSGKLDPTVSFAGGISQSQSSPDGESVDRGVAAQALQNALRKQVAKSGYGRGTRLAPKMIEGVNRPGTVSKMAGVFAEDGSASIEAKPMQRKSSVTSVLRDDFRGKVARENSVDEQGELQLERINERELGLNERDFVITFSEQRGMESGKDPTRSLNLLDKLVDNKCKSPQDQIVSSPSDRTSKNVVISSSGGNIRTLVSRSTTGRKAFGSSADNSDDDDSREESGDEYENDLVRPVSSKAAGARILGQKSNLEMIEADDEDSDVNSAYSNLKTSSLESLEEETRSLPIIKEGDLNRKLEKSVDRKRASAKTWKPIRAVLRGQMLNCYKEKGVVNNEDLVGPISINGAHVEIALNYVKRKHVFRVSTMAGNEYLFQASDTQDMMSWVNTLRECSQDKENFLGGIRSNDSGASPPTAKASVNRRGLSIKKSHFSLSRGSSKKRVNVQVTIPTKPAESPGQTFGVPLQCCPQSKLELNVPLIVEHCCNCIEDKGKELVGIYRVPGNAAAVLALQTELDAKQTAEINWMDEKWYDLNNLSSLLKSYLRKLPEPVIPSSMYEKIIQASRVPDLQSRLLCIKNIVKQLPEYHFETLRFLVKHLKVITDHSEKNKMEPKNIAIVFGPTIVRPSEENMITMVKDMSDQCKLIETLVHQDQTDLMGASRGLLEALESVNDCEASKKDKIASSVQKSFSNLKTNISLKIKNSAKGVSPMFPKRLKSEPSGGSEIESDEDRTFSGFTRANSIPSASRVSSKARLRFRSDDEAGDKRSRNNVGFVTTGWQNVRQSPMHEISASSVQGVPTKIGSFQAGSELQVKFINKSPDGPLPSGSNNRKDIFDASMVTLLSDKTRSRLQQVGSRPMWPKEEDEDSGVTVGGVRRGSDDAVSSTSESNNSSRKASCDSLSGPSPLIQRRQQPSTSRQVSSSSGDRSPSMSNQSPGDSSDVPLREPVQQYAEAAGSVLIRRRRNMPVSPRSTKRELYSISPGDSTRVDEKLRAMLAESECMGTDFKISDSGVFQHPQTEGQHILQHTNTPMQADRLNGPALKASADPQYSNNAEWWLSGPASESKRQAATLRDKAVAVSIISSAIHSTNRAGSVPVEGPARNDRMGILSPTTLRRAALLQSQPASFNPELSARVDTFKQKKVELEKKVSSILGQYNAPAASLTGSAVSFGGSIGSEVDDLVDETKQEKLDRYLQQVSALLKDSEKNSRALQDSDRQRLSMILQNLQRAVLLDCVKQEPDRIGIVSPSLQSWSRSNNVPCSNNNIEDCDASAGYAKYSKLYPR